MTADVGKALVISHFLIDKISDVHVTKYRIKRKLNQVQPLINSARMIIVKFNKTPTNVPFLNDPDINANLP